MNLLSVLLQLELELMLKLPQMHHGITLAQHQDTQKVPNTQTHRAPPEVRYSEAAAAEATATTRSKAVDQSVHFSRNQLEIV
ncbi:GL10353 [Drosophila persimilis]|uniref:GL10353 n=1 Tax=Drosophila persimilis TaxID=7234 RepID=B4GDH4_DROPE|nr:GL10353 [Drosophila persimilis]